MSENDLDKLSNKITAVADLAKAVPIYEDAIKPAALETGKALGLVGRAVNVALMPLRGIVWSAERIEHWLADKVATKLSGIPPEHIVSPDIQIAGPTIEALKFTVDKPVLQEMFAGVMAGAMNKDTCEDIHPSFVEKIKNLSELDAILFSYIATNDPIATLQFFTKTRDVEGQSKIVNFFNPEFCRIYSKKYPERKKQLAAIEASVEHLGNLGLVSAVDYGELTGSKSRKEYQAMERDLITQAFREKKFATPDTIFGTGRSYIRLSSFGQIFARTVL